MRALMLPSEAGLVFRLKGSEREVDRHQGTGQMQSKLCAPVARLNFCCSGRLKTDPLWTRRQSLVYLAHIPSARGREVGFAAATASCNFRDDPQDVARVGAEF
jgi:hypothetical protein